MHAIDLAPYCIHATDPANAAPAEYECLGLTLAHENAVELGEAGFKDVILSLGEVPMAATARSSALSRPVSASAAAELWQLSRKVMYPS